MNSLMSNQSLAKKWFQSCTTTHGRCRPRSCDTNFPTRLLEIDGSEKQTSVRIITTDKNPRAGEYMTLSHCWGAAQFITLRKDNLAELGQGIQLGKLPKTFQDAVAVAQWFEIRYLWIDSLCIVQDSQEDWVKESATMRSVYSRSTMNISATGAVDPSIGCFLDRKPDNILPFSALLSGSQIECICFEDNFWRANISDAPLSKRAWAFQERLLSPRILHFGAIQMSWECMESASCETFPEGVPDIGQLPSVITKREFFDHTRGSKSIRMWDMLVTYYTNCAMTVASDIYMAFAGVVEEIHSLTGEEYFAGFWRIDLERQLLWERNGPETGKPTVYRAPSWSWFSSNGAVRLPFLSPVGKGKAVYEVLDVIVHNSAEGLYGPVTYGCLRCRGVLGTAVCRKPSSGYWVIQAVHGQRLESEGRPQWDHKTDLSERRVTYLPVLKLKERVSDVVLALLLEPTHVKEGEYQRIGTWRIRGEGKCRSVLCEQMPGDGAWVDRPQKNFTIV